jgi:endogenous inhibitor of DNA gyrase (YacG/DUF329 family)
MDPESKRAGSMTFLLAGLVLLVTAAGLLIALVPMAPCPEKPLHVFIRRVHLQGSPFCCERCRDTERITFLNLWSKAKAPMVESDGPILY